MLLTLRLLLSVKWRAWISSPDKYFMKETLTEGICHSLKESLTYSSPVSHASYKTPADFRIFPNLLQYHQTTLFVVKEKAYKLCSPLDHTAGLDISIRNDTTKKFCRLLPFRLSLEYLYTSLTLGLGLMVQDFLRHFARRHIFHKCKGELVCFAI